MKKFKLMLVDDDITKRKTLYDNIFSSEKFEIVPIESYDQLLELRQTPVDGYVVDAFLDLGDWDGVGTADYLFANVLKNLPRSAPVFLVSSHWDDPKAAQILVKINQQKNVDVLRYLAFEEFENAINNEKLAKALRSKILDDLSTWHEVSLFRPKSGQTIRILLLADLQYCDPHTSETAIFDELWIGKALSRDSLIPDFLVLAGDISYTGDPSEYQIAKAKIESLIKFMWGKDKLDVMRERIILVPGNHDVNLRIAACDLFNWDRDKKDWKAKSNNTADYKNFALEPFFQFARSLTGSRSWDDFQGLCRVDRRFEHFGIRFILFNSITELTVDDPQKASFNVKALTKITQELGVDDKPESLFSMAISHHGIVQGGNKVIQMDNWGDAGNQWFYSHKIKLWFFGHYHKNSAYKFSQKPFNKENLGIVQAATLKIRPGENNRGFSLIELERSDGMVKTAKEYFYKLDENGASSEKPEPEIIFTTR